MKISVGMITKRLDSSNTPLRFLENAEKYGHEIDSVISTCSLGAEKRTALSIGEKAPLSVIDLNQPRYLTEQLEKRGISRASIDTLLKPPFHPDKGLVPYGFNRNQVLMEAILKNVDILIFVDSDVIPSVLTEADGELVFKEIDFFGRHLDSLNSGSQVTTSEYSGYNILPAARFDGMDDLLLGLQKESMIPYWADSDTHRCLATQDMGALPGPASKVLGGNAGFRVEAFSVLPAFYSSFYEADDGLYLARGEDTVLSLALEPSGITCTDIGAMIFHDTYRNYPQSPDLRNDAATQERFFYACAGWIGRNPFYSYLLREDLQETRELQRRHLAIGARALERYTSNPRFLSLPDKLEISWDNLARCISEYDKLLEAWSEFISKCGLG